MLKRQFEKVLFSVCILALLLSLSLQAGACTKRKDLGKTQTQLCLVSDESDGQSNTQTDSTTSDAQSDQNSDKVIGSDDESQSTDYTDDDGSDETASDDTY